MRSITLDGFVEKYHALRRYLSLYVEARLTFRTSLSYFAYEETAHRRLNA